MDAITHHHDFYKKSGQIPAFGNWDYDNELPITQYFECARQAGLIRYSSSSGDSNDTYLHGDLYAVDHYPQINKPSRTVNPLPAGRKTRDRREKRCPHVKEQKKQQQQAKAKVCDVTEPQRKPLRNDADSRPASPPPPPPPRRRLPKPVDEDLYEIPPALLHASKRKKRLGIFSRCLVPACTS